MILGGIPKQEVNNLRDSLTAGLYCKTPMGQAKILSIYPYWCHTDKGNWQWIEIYLAENGVRSAEKVKEIVKDLNV